MNKIKKLAKPSIELLTSNFSSLINEPNLFKNTRISLVQGMDRFIHVESDRDNDGNLLLLAERHLSTKDFPPFDETSPDVWLQIEVVINYLNQDAALYCDDDEVAAGYKKCYIWSKNDNLFIGLKYRGMHPVVLEVDYTTKCLKMYHSYGSFNLDIMVRRFIDPKDKRMLNSISNAEHQLAELAYKEVEFWQDEDIQACFTPIKNNN